MLNVSYHISKCVVLTILQKTGGDQLNKTDETSSFLISHFNLHF